MCRRISKRLVLSITVACLCIAVVFSFVSSVLAQGQIHVYGEITGGYADVYTIQLKLGEMIQGETIARNGNLGLSITDYTGKSIYDFGYCSTQCGFTYAAKATGEYHLLVSNPDTFSIGTRGYNIYYTISPTNLPPGSGSGQPVTGTGQASHGKGAWFWGVIAAILVVALIVIAIRILRWKMESEEINGRVREQLSKSPQQLEAEIARIRRKKRDLERRMEILSKTRSRLVIFPENHYDFDSIESQIADIRRQLELLDIQEDNLEEILNSKKLRNG